MRRAIPDHALSRHLVRHRDLLATSRLRLARLPGDVPAIVTLLAAIALLTWDRLRYPTHLAQTDLFSYFLPTFSYLGERLSAGDIPAWNPHQFSGAPFAGNPESGWMYLPAMVAFALLSPLAALKTFVVFHVALSALATYALGRALGFRPIAALAAGAAYAFGPVLTHTACCTVFAQVEAWFPVTVLGAELAVRQGTRVRAAGWLLAGLGLSQIMGAWLGQGAYYGLLLLGSYLVFRTLILPPHGAQPISARLRALALHGSIILGLGFGLAAAGLLPRLDALGRSTLAGGNYAGAGRAVPEEIGWEPLALALRGLSDAAGGRYHFGGAVVVLAVAAPIVARRRGLVAYFAALTVIAVVLAMQPNALHSLFYLLPRFETLQSHVANRILIVAFFGAAILVGATVDAIGESRRRLALLAAAAVGAAWALRLLLPALPNEELTVSNATVQAATLTIAILLTASLSALPWFWGQAGVGYFTSRVLPVVLLGVVLWDPAVRWWGDGQSDLNPEQTAVLEQHAASVAELGGAAAFLASRQGGEDFRFFGFGPAIQGFGRNGCCDYHKEVLTPEGEALLVGNRSLTLGLQDIQGYDPVQESRYFAYFQVLNDRPQDYHEAGVMPDGLDSPLVDLLNVRYAIVPAVPSAAAQPDVDGLVDEWWTVYEDDQVKVLENPDALPRAWIVHDVERVTREQALTMLAEGQVDPRTEALVEIRPPNVEQPGEPAEDQADITVAAPDEIHLTTRTDAPGLLVLSEVYDPGWKAYLDGEMVELYQTDYLLRGVAIPSGAHEIELRYEPGSLRAGMVVSSAAVVGSAALALVALNAWAPLLAVWVALHSYVQRLLLAIKRLLGRRRLSRRSAHAAPSSPPTPAVMHMSAKGRAAEGHADDREPKRPPLAATPDHPSLDSPG